MAEALESLRADRGEEEGRLVEGLAKGVRGGRPLSAVMAEVPWIPRDHVIHVRIGETMGRLDLMLGRLIARLDQRRAAWKELVRRASYPVLLIFMAAVLLPSSLLVVGSAGTYFAIVSAVLLPALAAYVLVRKWSSVFPPGSPARARMERVLAATPLLDASLGEVLGSLGLLVEAGLPIGESIDLAAQVSRWDTLRPQILSMGERIRSGSTFAEALGECPEFLRRRAIVSRIAVGETAGRLDAALREAGRALEERAFDRTIAALRILPLILIPIVGIAVLWVAVKTFSGIYGGF